MDTSDTALLPPAAQVSPASVEAVYATACWLLGQDRVADAARIFRLLLHAAPRDERGWLGLGECHERSDQLRIALQLYGAGGVVADSVRCLVASARALRRLDLASEADAALDGASSIAARRSDRDLAALVERERERPR